MSNVVKSFNILVISLSVLYNYFDDNKIILKSVYLVKFLDTSAKPFLLDWHALLLN